MADSSAQMVLSTSIREFLNEQPVGHLATVDSNNAPHVVPVCFALVDDDVFIPIDRKPKSTTRLKRIRNIEQNPRVALTVDVYQQDWSKLRWVMLHGHADVEYEGSAAQGALRALRQKYPQYLMMDLTGRPLIRLRPERINEWTSA